MTTTCDTLANPAFAISVLLTKYPPNTKVIAVAKAIPLLNNSVFKILTVFTLKESAASLIFLLLSELL